MTVPVHVGGAFTVIIVVVQQEVPQCFAHITINDCNYFVKQFEAPPSSLCRILEPDDLF